MKVLRTDPAPAIWHITETVGGLPVVRALGGTQYATLALAVDEKLQVLVQVNGRTVATLGPWTAQAQPGMIPGADVRLRVFDACDPSRADALAPAPVLDVREDL